MKLYTGSYFAFFTSNRNHWVDIELHQPTRLTDILSELGIPAGEVHLVVLNGELLESTDTLVSNDDIVRLYPAINGG
jgi:sulfur carrier protein ThiS